jgi:hypothetical protein
MLERIRRIIKARLTTVRVVTGKIKWRNVSPKTHKLPFRIASMVFTFVYLVNSAEFTNILVSVLRRSGGSNPEK